MTGAPLPAGADAVIPFEQTREAAGVVRLLSTAGPGANVRPAGQARRGPGRTGGRQTGQAPTFAMVQGKPVFGLPSFPVSSLVCFEQFVRPELRLLGGWQRLCRPCVLEGNRSSLIRQ
jgi:molybdopterin biosynthesis enzyme